MRLQNSLRVVEESVKCDPTIYNWLILQLNRVPVSTHTAHTVWWSGADRVLQQLVKQLMGNKPNQAEGAADEQSAFDGLVHDQSFQPGT